MEKDQITIYDYPKRQIRFELKIKKLRFKIARVTEYNS